MGKIPAMALICGLLALQADVKAFAADPGPDKAIGQGRTPSAEIGNRIGPRRGAGRDVRRGGPQGRPIVRQGQRQRPREFRQGPGQRQCVTPYGAVCPKCSAYGTETDHPVRPDEAFISVESFFKSQGLFVRHKASEGRFMMFDVMDAEGNVVDKVIFDRKTGRLRSID